MIEIKDALPGLYTEHLFRYRHSLGGETENGRIILVVLIRTRVLPPSRRRLDQKQDCLRITNRRTEMRVTRVAWWCPNLDAAARCNSFLLLLRLSPILLET